MHHPAPTALIAEDEIFIVLDVENILQSIAVDVIAAFSSNALALQWLRENRPTFAIIDYQLRDGSAKPLASALAAQGIPFIIYSGYPQPEDRNDIKPFAWIIKSSDRATIEKAARALIEAGGVS